MATQPNNFEETITLKEVILKLREVFRFILSRWKTLLIFGVVFAIFGLVFTYLKKPEYEAKLTFVVEESNAESPLQGAASLASQFGFDIGMGGSTAFSKDNLLELLKSRRIVQTALLMPIERNGNNKLLINHYVESRNIGFGEKLKEEFGELLTFPANIENFNLVQDSLMRKIHKSVVEDYLSVKNTSSTASIIEVNGVTKDELFSKKLVENLVNGVSEFYIKTKTQRARETLNFVEERTDSIHKALEAAELELAKWKDASKSIIKAEGYLTEIRLMRKVEILNAMYAEAVKNLEMSKVTLLNQKPLIQIIDEPTLPLEVKEISKPLGIVLGIVLGLFMGVCYLIAVKIYRDAMES